MNEDICVQLTGILLFASSVCACVCGGGYTPATNDIKCALVCKSWSALFLLHKTNLSSVGTKCNFWHKKIPA